MDVPRTRIRVQPQPRRVSGEAVRISRPTSSSTHDTGRAARYAPYPPPRRAPDIHASTAGLARHNTPSPLDNLQNPPVQAVSSFGESSRPTSLQLPPFQRHLSTQRYTAPSTNTSLPEASSEWRLPGGHGDQYIASTMNGTSATDNGSQRTISDRDNVNAVWRDEANNPYQSDQYYAPQDFPDLVRVSLLSYCLPSIDELCATGRYALGLVCEIVVCCEMSCRTYGHKYRRLHDVLLYCFNFNSISLLQTLFGEGMDLE